MKIATIHTEIKFLSLEGPLNGAHIAGPTVAILSDDGKAVHGIFGPTTVHTSHLDAESCLTALKNVDTHTKNLEAARAVIRTEIRGNLDMMTYLQRATEHAAIRADSLTVVLQDMESNAEVGRKSKEPAITRSQMIAAFQRLQTHPAMPHVPDTPEAWADAIIQAVALNENGAASY